MRGRLAKLALKRIGEAKTQTETIGVIGAGMGCGTTHLTLSAASCLGGGRGKQVACVELGRSGAFAGLEQSLFGSEGRGQSFVFGGLYYMKGGTSADWVHTINLRYDYVIADMGRDYERVRMDYLRCGRKIVLTALSPWREEEFEHFMECAAFESGYREWHYCYVFGSSQAARRMEKRYGIELLRVPFQEDILRLTQRELDFYYCLLGLEPGHRRNLR